jgi:hypothetical protein
VPVFPHAVLFTSVRPLDKKWASRTLAHSPDVSMVVLRTGCHTDAAQAVGQPSKTLPCSDSLNHFAQFLSWFEEGNSLRWHFDSGSGFWIASDARSSLAGVESSESPDFNLVAGSQGTDDAVQYGANDNVGFL